MQQEWEEVVRNKASLRDLLVKPQHLRPLFVTVCVMVFMQTSGIMPVLGNLSVIFKAAGSSLSPNTSAMLVGVVQVLASVTSALLVDHTGRKVLLVLSASVMSLTLVVLGIYFALIEGDEGGGGSRSGEWVEEHLSWLPLTFLIIYFIGFCLGFGTIPWLLMSELFSPAVRDAASGLVIMVNWIVSFGITFVFQPLQDSVGASWVFLILAGFCLLAAIFSALVVPETKGLTLQQVSALFTATSSEA
ncbi:hypothetical protein Pcinc_027635 [Petrolisthes cinctipes]|uniref:Major facilitator superfamily (MFS) profile domain-containing protein n=1 Tax=Petrolisthes cinctipes TaxID=88211 RepID=A0AAE1K8I8_PETCI|nr:hypothetical protein Pcinc_027635 [Petrolisthes cinctipes]